MKKVIQWAENPGQFTSKHDLTSMMAFADDMGMDELFALGSKCIYDQIRGRSEIPTDVHRLLHSMADPIRFRLLDHAEPDGFELLRTAIPPYRHQYQRQVKKMLPNICNAATSDIDLTAKTYETVMLFQKVMRAEVRNRMYRLDMRTRSDRSESSHDCHHLFTLERISHTLTIWDLLHPPFAPVGVWDHVVDAAFEPAGLLFTLELDGHIRGRSVSGAELVCIPCGPADSLSVSKDCLLAYSTTTLSGNTVRLWRWSPEVQVLDARAIEGATTACMSADGELVIHSRLGVVQTSSVDPHKTSHCRMLDDARNDKLHERGDVIAHAVSPDSHVVAAVYVCGIRFWWMDEARTSQFFDLSETDHQTFGHAAFSPDSRFVALGSWEGNIIVLQRRERVFEVCSRLRVGNAVLHLSWSQDGIYLVISSYAGASFVRAHRQGVLQ